MSVVVTATDTRGYTVSVTQNITVLAYKSPKISEISLRRTNDIEAEMQLIFKGSLVQNSGVTESLCAGIGGCLIFGLGLCLAMEVIGQMIWLGVILGLIGTAGMLAAFPVYRKFFNKAKALHSPRILELAAQLSGQVS